MSGWTAEVLDFWFGLEPERHWRQDDALDAEIAAKFKGLRERESNLVAPVEARASGVRAEAGDQASHGPGLRRDDGLGAYLTSPDTALAAIILLDQFPRNMFRGSGRSFATDPLALRIAEGAVARGYDQQLPTERRVFMYLPFEHSERSEDQDRSVALFEAMGEPRYLDFARKHRVVIARFGRFPHRNAMLGRESTPEEQAFGLEPAW